MESPLIWQICRINWQIFGTLTLKSLRLSERMQSRQIMRYFEITSRKLGVNRKSVQWVVRSEHGELGGRLHYHFLLGGLKPSQLSRTTEWFLWDLWHNQINGGRTDIRRYNPRLPGVSYIMKGLDGADVYESAKFGQSQVTWSQGVQERLSHSARMTNTAGAH